MLRWLAGRGASADETHAMLDSIPEALWKDVLAAHPFFNGLQTDDLDDLRKRAAWLLASKQINGAGGLELSDFMRLSICAQAALPVLKLPPELYEGWEEIIVYPAGIAAPRSVQDDDGVVHEYIEEAVGESWEGGPVVLAWEAAGDTEGAFNVVIHEFAHKLDQRAGGADGMPDLLGAINPQHWRVVLENSLESFRLALDDIEAAIPGDVDPESEAADAWYAALPLDPYAATDEAEFFAVSSEHFFADPWPLSQALPDWYGVLSAYYRQDPLARLS